MLNPTTNPTMAGRITAADADFPFSSAKDETTPGAGDGTPYFKARADDIFGLQQALVTKAGITPSGNADNANASDVMDAIEFLVGASDRKNWPTIANDGTDPAKDLVFSAGRIPSSDGKKIIVLPSQLIKQLDATFAVGTNAGGVPAPIFPIAADATVFPMLIVKDSDGSIDAYLDTDLNGANIPAGYTAFRLIFPLVLDSSADFRAFTIYGRTLKYDQVAANDISTATGVTSGTLLALSKQPIGMSTIVANVITQLLSAASVRYYVRAANHETATPGVTNQDGQTITGTGDAIGHIRQIPLNANAEVMWATSIVGITNFQLKTDGYTFEGEE